MAQYLQLIYVFLLWFSVNSATEPEVAVAPLPLLSPEIPQEDECLERYGGIQLNYDLGSVQMYEFDMCSVLDCGDRTKSALSVLYVCDFGSKGGPRAEVQREEGTCYDQEGNPKQECPPLIPMVEEKCVRSEWALLTSEGNVGLKGEAPRLEALRAASSIRRRLKVVQGKQTNVNLIVLTLGGITENFYDMNGLKCGTNSRDHFYLILATELNGREKRGLLKINLIRPRDSERVVDPINPINPAGREIEDNSPVIPDKESGGELPKINKKTRIIETGYIQQNIWRENLVRAASVLGKKDCYMCAQARPKLIMTPTTFEISASFSEGEEREEITDPDHECLLELMSKDNPSQSCRKWDSIYTVTAKHIIPPVFSPEFLMKVTCFESNPKGEEKEEVGQIELKYCYEVEDITTHTLVSKLLVERADVWWYCGGRALRGHLPSEWKGRCALVSLVSPVQYFTMKDVEEALSSESGALRRMRRSVENPLPLPEYHSPTYLDAIGVPRGVPDEYKLANPVANGFESIFLWVTPNKNVDRINFIYFNVQTLANFTRDGFEATHEQLKATSLMAYQNRVALDMLLAEKGGVCTMFKGVCCTFIPNNTASDGTLTRALEGLKTLSEELKDKAGIDNSWEDWFSKYFGKWGSLMSSMIMGILVSISIITVLACCCIPCIRALVLRCIDKAVAPVEKTQIPTAYQFLTKVLGPESNGKDKEENIMLTI